MAEAQPSQLEALRALASHVRERLHRGELPDSIRADLIGRGLAPNITDALLAGFAPGEWQKGARGWALCIIGIAVMLAGGFVWFGNQNGFFPPFPFAGTLTVFAGAALFVIGGGKLQLRRTRQKLKGVRSLFPGRAFD